VNELTRVGISLETGNSLLTEDIIDELEQQDRYLLLVVDALDKLFASRSHFDVAKRTIGSLKVFGESKEGRVSVLVCGSATSLPALISNDVSNDLPKRFPLMDHVSSMNGTTYEQTRIYSSTPTDMEALASMLGTDSKDTLSLFSFLAGTNARQLDKLHRVLTNIGRIPKGEAHLNTAFHEVMLPVKMKDIATKTHESEAKFYDFLMREMFTQNQKMFDQIFEEGDINFDKVKGQDWSVFVPLNKEQVIQCFKEATGLDDIEHARRAVYYLADRTWIVLGDSGAGFPSSVYPIRFCDVALADKENVHVKVKNFISKMVSNPAFPTLLDFVKTTTL